MMIPSPSEEATAAIIAAYPPTSPATLPTAADFRRLAARLRRVCDAAPVVQGAGTHRWRLPPPLDERAVAEFEDRHRLVLPVDHREFLLNIADAPPGPVGVTPALRDSMLAHRHDSALWFGPSIPGALNLSYRTKWGAFALRLDGPARGTVWLALSLRPEPHPTGLHFFAWYERWLDSIVAEVDAAEAPLDALEREVAADGGGGRALCRLACLAAAHGRDALAASALARARVLGSEPTREEIVELIVHVTTLPSSAAIASRLRGLLAADFPLPGESSEALRLELGSRLVELGRHAEALAVLVPLRREGCSFAARSRVLGDLVAEALRQALLGEPGEGP